MTTFRRSRSLPVRGLGLLGLTLIVVAASQVIAAARAGSQATPPVPAQAATVEGPVVADLDVGGGTATGTPDDTTRINANISFWSRKLVAHPTDFVAAEQLGESQIELARATGDLGAYVAAGQSLDTAIGLYADMPAALAFKGVVLVSLHRFDEARRLAETVLAEHPDDPTALATLGDASLELGSLDAATRAYDRLAKTAPSAAASVRLGHLAFIRGDTATALAHARAAVAQAAEEEAAGERAGFYSYQLADTLIATGNRQEAEHAYRDAIAHDPHSFLAHAGLGRALAADGRLDDAIKELSAAIAIVPQPDSLARRADLYTIRNASGDAARAEKDRRTVLAIAQLATAAGNVYDRTLSLYLANHGLETARAVELATKELEIRKDVYGYDAIAWALLADGRATDANRAIQTALAVGTKDAKILYHAGMIALAIGDNAQAKAQLSAALALDPSFDALQAKRAADALAGL
ncbi:MAG TPA: tetratricopeptide repeat protein [Candidatus Limnocylindrales bacterium]|nr:tetratricopeptide repeat protein [Candidatus Limnocylindrales bacterium]